jgi:hypothetical protein
MRPYKSIPSDRWEASQDFSRFSHSDVKSMARQLMTCMYSGRKSIRDDFVNLGRKTITEMGCADFDMLDLDIVVIDASTPRHDGISAVTGLRSTILFVMRSPLPSDRDRNRDD